MKTAGQSFNHIVQAKKSDTHALVTTGIYSSLRHPSYFGFFWWAVGTQLTLGNSVSLVGYVYVLWKFFRHRITQEEHFLVQFFGVDYVEYRKRVGTGIPYVK